MSGFLDSPGGAGFERRSSFNVGAPAAQGSRGRRRSTMGSVLMNTETIKERQQKARDMRDVRRSRLQPPHKYVLTIVANHLKLDYGAVEDFVLDSERNLQVFEMFLQKDGSRSLKFYYQDGSTPGLEECGRVVQGVPKGTVVPRVLVTSGTGNALHGQCVYFLRTKTDINLTSKNIDEEVTFGVLDVSQEPGVLSAFENVMSSIFQPSLKQLENWGDLQTTPQGRKSKKLFLDNFENFLQYLRSAQANAGEGVHLVKCTSDKVNLAEIVTINDCIDVAANPEVVSDMEDLAMAWCKQIEQILAESDQMRKEADDTGPLAELDHWRQLMARFNALLEQIKSNRCRMVINIINIARSKVLKKWKELDKKITDNANEAKDNVKFLYTLEKYCEPLYRCDPVSMTDSLPGLVNAIRMIHSISRYYNTSERMTSLFIKVTNQMVTACKNYITDDGVSRIWDQPRQPLIEKLENSVSLFRNYQAIFQRTKKKIEATPGEKPFEFSEMYIFGKFETFCKRLEKIITLLNSVQAFSALSESKIEGIELYSSRFLQIYSSLRKKPYDILDHRKLDFDNDFDDFKRQLGDLESGIQKFMEGSFSKITSASQALTLLTRFESLELPRLKIEEKYTTIMVQYGGEIEEIRKLYMKCKEDPPIPRNMPPVSGKITWARQLSQRIEVPMNIFAKRASCLKSDDAKRIIRNYNRMMRVLLEYEMLYHEAWKKSVGVATKFLQAPVLVRHPLKQGLLLVNFDPYIFEVIKEAEYMMKLDLEIPKAAIILVHSKDTLTAHNNRLQMLLDENNNLRADIPPIFVTLLRPSLKKVDVAMRPGLVNHTWTSLSLPIYFDIVSNALNDLGIVVKQVNDIKETRIDSMLHEISETLLCDLPERSPWTVSQFLKKMEGYCKDMGQQINKISHVIEDAVAELIRIFLHRAQLGQSIVEGEPSVEAGMDVLTIFVGTDEGSDVQSVDDNVSDMSDEQNIREACDELKDSFNHRLVEALLKASRHSLDVMRRRFFSGGRRHGMMHFDESVGGSSTGSRKVPFFTANITLSIPHVVMQPGLEDIQQALNRATQMVVDISKDVYQWGQDRTRQFPSDHKENTSFHHHDPLAYTIKLLPPVPLKHYHKSIADNKDVSKYVMMMSSALSTLKADIMEALQRYSDYAFLWEKDREEAVTEFIAEDPILSEYKTKVAMFKKLEDNIEDIQTSEKVGAIELFTEPLKLALRVEIKAWKLLFGKELNRKYRNKMEEVCNFIEDYSKRLARPIRDLEDVREAMAALTDIRENTIQIDMTLGPVEESYAMLQDFGVTIPKEETDKVDSVRYSFHKLISSSNQIQDELVSVQPGFKSELLTSVEVFHKDVSDFGLNYDTEGPMCEGITPTEANDRLQAFQSHFDELYNKYGIYSAGEQLFGLTVTEYPSLMRIRKELGLLQKLYGLYSTVMTVISGYFDILWTEVDIDKINGELGDLQNRCRRLPKALKEWQAFLELKKKIDDFSESCPLLELMSNKAMKERHWDRIAKMTGHTFDFDSENFTLRDIMKAPLLKYKEDIEDVCISAVKEKDIEAKLSVVIADWNGRLLSYSNFKARGELLLKGVETAEIIAMLEDSLMILSSLLSNRYNAPFKKTIQEWVAKLSNTNDILENWLIVQNLWVYLEAVFVGGDIAKQLPQEAKRFQNIDKSWVKIMQRAHEVTNVVQCCVGDETLGQLLPHLLEQLELCQKSLTGYLEKKRLVFPRFFFISDPALLEILGQASDSHTIQAHLLGIFENVNEVQFHEKDYDRMMAVISREGEKIMLETEISAKGNVEMWLGELLYQQQRSLHGVIRDAFRNIDTPEFELLGFLANFPAQVGLLGIQMIWTRDAEIALQHARSDKKIMLTTNQRFLDMLNKLIEQTTHDLTKVERIKYETLVTIHVHQRDIFDDLTRMHIKSVTDFEWLKQARFYFKEDTDQCIVQITDVDFIYQNEFLGCTDRLVITPLTDRCYITLAQALGMSMGGAPAGPAGTGKTETTKDMGKALGKYVVVFNCSDQMDFRGLGRIYKGLAQSGSWGCFDEFNRIELPVLSVAAQQIYIVLVAKKERKKEFIFTDGDNVNLNPEFGLFITMNPGYAGRQELPENLKVQFRTVAMMVPDRQIIMRVKLASCGFQENIILAQKFYTLYKLCEEQLSKQVHYDFGLRNILSVLRTLGANKRARPNDTESTIVMRVLRDMNLSKLVDEDEPLFMSLIADLFPGIVLDSASYAELQVAIGNQVENAGLVNHPPWNLKLVQLFETQRVRHGMMTLGPSGAGKTCCIYVLMKSMADCGTPHREMRMNPKAITAPQMFGRLDVATNDWTDGIFSTLWRRTLKAKKGENVWLVLDGPVDAIWIENLNSVLDDNKTLTLANGDRIPMSPACKIVFEVHNIDNASPATVSRNGMVYMSSSALDWRPILQGWLKTRSPQESEVLMNLFDKIFDDVFNFVTNSLVKKMDVLQCNQIKQACDLLEGLIPKRDDKSALPASHLEKLFIFSLMWSLGALLELDGRAKMEEFITNHECSLNLPPVKEDETIFEYVMSVKGDWEHWSKRVEEYIYPTDSVPEFSSILVLNVDNVRSNFLIDTIAKQHKAVLLIGEQGTAKTVMIKGYMAKYDPDLHLGKSFNFSSASTPMMFQRTIESYVDKRMGSTYGPPGGRRMTVFVDDVNMPVINEWGDQITNEITRQMMEMHGMYSLDKPGDFISIVDLQFVGAMIHPGGGRNDIPQRLKRMFSIFNCTLPSNNSIDKIFGIIGCGYFCPERFEPEVCTLTKELIPATRSLWQMTKIKMLPTPAKFHYIFNLRDLSRIWQGMLTIKGEECQNMSTLLALWKHECTRVIADRFTNHEDKSWFENATVSVMKNLLGEEYAAVCPEEPYFVDFLREPPEPTGEEADDAVLDAPKIYEAIPGYDFLNEKLLSYMSQYNEMVRGAHMDLVFFKDAMVHLIKISRIIRTPRGAALLVGVGGSGKQSLTRLASYIASYKIFQITLTRSYNVTNLMEDLKYLYRVAGCQGQGITFLFTDNEIKDESFLEYLNNVLSSGEVSNLFARDELDEITQELIGVMKKEYPRRAPTQETLYDYFISRARSNLHTVLCFSPVGEKFRNRSLKFPGLISGCTMDWFSRWPKDALIAVSGHFLNSFDIACTKEIKSQLVNSMGSVHDNVALVCVDYFQRYRRQTHVTPKSYLSFLDGYKNVYSGQHSDIAEMARRMNTGLEKLIEASASVDALSKELVVKEKELAQANIRADKVLADVTVSATAAEKVKSAVQKVKDRAQKIVDEINSEKSVAHAKLAAAKPALQEAENALKTIKPSDIATVKKLGKPPHLIMRIMDCALLLFQKRLDTVTADPERICPKPSWGESLKLLSGSSFLSTLQSFPKDSINAETVELLSVYLNMEDYTFETAKKVCGSVAGLLSWTTAMSFFFGINREVLPLKANLAKQEARLLVASTELAGAQGQLDAKQKELDAVQAMYDAAMQEKQELLDNAESCRRRMTAASTLIGGLAGEKVRWTQQSKLFKAQIERLVGDVLMCTGFLSYSGPFNQEFRTKLLNNWQKELSNRNIPFTSNLNLITMLVDNATIGEWNIQGLPNDELSVQNGIVTTKASRYPLLIDPQGQGKTWIKNREKERDLQVTSLNHKYFRSHLEDALSLGRPLLLEDAGEELDPALDNVLEKNFIKSGSTFKVKVGDKECDVMSEFYLYITTKLPNPAYSPEVSARTAIIDFTVTMKGLEDQLLGRVIMTEKNELEADRAKLMLDVTVNKRKMQELEDNLLYKLTSTKGSLVDDESLIQVLSNTKVTAAEVSEKLTVAAETEIKINEAREEYRPVATRGSILYFLICDMSMVNKMYQTSLKQFLGLFDISMHKSEKSPVPAKRIHNIIEFLTFEVFRYTCRSLYEEHKFLFTLLITFKINIQKGQVRPEEFQTFIKGGAALDLNAVTPKPARWIMDVTWLNLVQLSGRPQFSEILNQVSRNEKAWKAWFDTEAPEEEQVPDGYSASLDSFRKLMLIRSWCPDRTIPQARKFIGDAMGQQYAEPVILNMETTWGESDNRTPLICLLSMGSDPTNQIEGLCKKQNLEFRAISMGQGQEVHARKLISLFMQTGGFAMLQNCHLGLDFMDELLETIVDTQHVHEDFRVWITTEVHPAFPISLLQCSIKFTNEPPQGIKAGLKRTYAGITQDYLDINTMMQWKPMLFGVSFIHTVVQERRKFGPLGWNIPYEFNSSDWTASVQFVQNHLDDIDPRKGISWNTVRYMLGEVQYGGRVTDDYDKRLLNTFGRVWFGDFMFLDSFQFYIGYKIPKVKSIDDTMAFIENLPLVDSPEALGLHTNADITYQTNLSTSVLETMMSIQPKDSGGGAGETRESIVYKMASDMLSKLPGNYLPHEVRDRLRRYGHLQPLNIFLKQEIDRMQRVIFEVRVTLTDLRLAIDGTIIMSENLRDALDNMFDARVPSLWRKISWASSTLGFWFTELLERNEQFHAWVFVGRPDVFWMTGFFNPQGFLTAMRQEVTRAHKGWALDSVTLHNEVIRQNKEDISAAPAEGVFVYGLFLDGAAWDRRNSRLCESTPKVLFTALPVVHMFAINSTAAKDPRLYQCPVYKKPNRTDLTYITFIVLKTNQNPDHWILRGVGALCDIK
ncbi:dynein heavy chain 8, axonemal-like [Mizuhopecten yessoensis]|uniref:Dynein heavy chain 8, axonemal n=3 Tax=Mizuhopecten yessoensis TaxID=6573 RepID=A0A210Q0A9_MIZYE|nr:dynein heavy chain 8, axonemal-like [Mizuhopecten yessoensis]OWF42162.1 Dynein heavy chain 8, axonemal [Mizuhopecten yessoensis]